MKIGIYRIKLLVITSFVALGVASGGSESLEFAYPGEDVLPEVKKASGGMPSLLCNRSGHPELGLVEIQREELSKRTLEIEVFSSAMNRSEKILVTLPLNYASNAHKKYPVLMLLHGGEDNQRSWFDNNLENIVGDREIIIVTPNAGGQGTYSDHYGVPKTEDFSGSGEVYSQNWESFHVREVMPYVVREFRVSDRYEHRAIAGLSKGGGGAAKYAAAYPGTFSNVGIFSGWVNPTALFPVLPLVTSSLQMAFMGQEGDKDVCAWSDPIFHKVHWLASDPTYIAENLVGTKVWITGGNGFSGDLDEQLGVDAIELVTSVMTENFIGALEGVGVEYHDARYGNGRHSWEYWSRALDEFITWNITSFESTEVPESFNYRSASHEFGAWGWKFVIDRNVDEFVYLKGVSDKGFDVVGSGVLAVLTPSIYEPNSDYTVISGGVTESVRSSQVGRLKYQVVISDNNDSHQKEFDNLNELSSASVLVY